MLYKETMRSEVDQGVRDACADGVVNSEGMTFQEWFNAATYSAPVGHAWSLPTDIALGGWKRGEDPCEWRLDLLSIRPPDEEWMVAGSRVITSPLSWLPGAWGYSEGRGAERRGILVSTMRGNAMFAPFKAHYLSLSRGIFCFDGRAQWLVLLNFRAEIRHPRRTRHLTPAQRHAALMDVEEAAEHVRDYFPDEYRAWAG